jgi:hypothetical protein
MVGWYLHFTQERFLIVLQLENRTSLVIFMTYGTTPFFCQWLLCELSGSDFHGTLSLFGLLIISSALSSTSCRLRSSRLSSLRIHGEQAGFHLMYSKIAVEEICTTLGDFINSSSKLHVQLLQSITKPPLRKVSIMIVIWIRYR